MISDRNKPGKSADGQSDSDAKLNSNGPNVTNKEESKQRREALGRSLRRVYQDVVQEGVPDDLAELMKKLDQISESDL